MADFVFCDFCTMLVGSVGVIMYSVGHYSFVNQGLFGMDKLLCLSNLVHLLGTVTMLKAIAMVWLYMTCRTVSVFFKMAKDRLSESHHQNLCKYHHVFRAHEIKSSSCSPACYNENTSPPPLSKDYPVYNLLLGLQY